MQDDSGAVQKTKTKRAISTPSPLFYFLLLIAMQKISKQTSDRGRLLFFQRYSPV